MNRGTAGFLKRIFNAVKRPNLSFIGTTHTSVTFEIKTGGIDGIRSYKVFRNGVEHETVTKKGSSVIYTDKQLAPGSSYSYFVRANAKGDDGKRSHRLHAETRWKDNNTNNVKTYTPGFGIQYTRGVAGKNGHLTWHPKDAMAIMYIGGDEVICQVQGGNDGDIHDIQFKTDKVYYELVDKRRRKMAEKWPSDSWAKPGIRNGDDVGNSAYKDGREGIKGCREFIVNNGQYADDAENDEWTVTVVKYYDQNHINGKACKVQDHQMRDVIRVPLHFYHMVRKASGTYHADDKLELCR